MKLTNNKLEELVLEVFNEAVRKKKTTKKKKKKTSKK